MAPLEHVFDVANSRFVAPHNMLEAIASWFGERGLAAPRSVGEVARAIYDSLALSYRSAIAALEAVLETPVDSIHIVGGGSKAPLLCQAVADATGRTVLTGPEEAAVAGNMVCQLMASGVLADLEEGRALVRRSTAIGRYAPSDGAAWNDASRRLHEFAGRKAG